MRSSFRPRASKASATKRCSTGRRNTTSWSRCATWGIKPNPLGVSDDLGVVRKAIDETKPHIAFNLLEEFHGVAVFDQHIAAYLELMKLPYTGCNPRGLMLAHDKALSKKILSYHRILTPHFVVFERGRTVKLRKRYPYPLLVKSVIEEASLGISRKSIVHDEQQLRDRIDYVHEELQDRRTGRGVH